MFRLTGFLCLLVSSANKKDVRTIEQVMADNRARKRLKTHHVAAAHGCADVTVAAAAADHGADVSADTEADHSDVTATEVSHSDVTAIDAANVS